MFFETKTFLMLSFHVFRKVFRRGATIVSNLEFVRKIDQAVSYLKYGMTMGHIVGKLSSPSYTFISNPRLFNICCKYMLLVVSFFKSKVDLKCENFT